MTTIELITVRLVHRYIIIWVNKSLSNNCFLLRPLGIQRPYKAAVASVRYQCGFGSLLILSVFLSAQLCVYLSVYLSDHLPVCCLTLSLSLDFSFPLSHAFSLLHLFLTALPLFLRHRHSLFLLSHPCYHSFLHFPPFSPSRFSSTSFFPAASLSPLHSFSSCISSPPSFSLQTNIRRNQRESTTSFSRAR